MDNRVGIDCGSRGWAGRRTAKVEKLETNKSSSRTEWNNELWYKYTMDYYVTMGMNKLWLHTTTWMNFRHIILNERSPTQKDTCSFFKDFIYLLLERREGKQKERERNINVWLHLASPLLGAWPATQACALTGNWTCYPILVHRPTPNPLSHTSQAINKLPVSSLWCWM